MSFPLSFIQQLINNHASCQMKFYYSPNDEWDLEVDAQTDLKPSDWSAETGYDKIEHSDQIYPRPGPGKTILCMGNII